MTIERRDGFLGHGLSALLAMGVTAAAVPSCGSSSGAKSGGPSVSDGGVMDTGSSEAGNRDAGVADTGGPDTESPSNESGAPDAGSFDGAAPSACKATLENHDNSPVTGFPNGPGTTSVSLAAAVHAAGDLVAITAWCFPINSYSGGCTPSSVTLGAQTAVQTTVSGNPDPGTAGSPGSGQGRIFYVLSAAASGSPTITFTIEGSTNQQLQVAYLDFTASAGCSFAHDVDSPLGSGQSTGASITSPSITPTTGDVLFDFTWTSSHMVDPVGSPWATAIWQPELGHFLDNSVNLIAYDLSAPAGATSNSANTLHPPTDSWQSLLTSFTMSTP